MRRRKPVAGRPGWNGDGTCRFLDRDFLRRPEWPGDGIHRARWIGRAEAEMAAADGALRKDRLFRPDGAADRLGRGPRAADAGAARKRTVGPGPPEALDR